MRRSILPVLIAVLTCVMLATDAIAIYHPVLGCFVQRDPIGYPDGMNGYAGYQAFHHGLDPSGLDFIAISSNSALPPLPVNHLALTYFTQPCLKAKEGDRFTASSVPDGASMTRRITAGPVTYWQWRKKIQTRPRSGIFRKWQETPVRITTAWAVKTDKLIGDRFYVIKADENSQGRVERDWTLLKYWAERYTYAEWSGNKTNFAQRWPKSEYGVPIVPGLDNRRNVGNRNNSNTFVRFLVDNVFSADADVIGDTTQGISVLFP